MLFLFTTSNKLGAKAIRWALGEPCSHVAVVFDEQPDGKGIVFHSSFNGVSFDWFGSFVKNNRIIFALKPITMTVEDEEKIYQSIVSKFHGNKYDYRLFAEFAFYALRRKLTREPIPSKGLYGNESAFLCTELAKKIAVMQGDLMAATLPVDLITPYQLYSTLVRSKNMKQVVLV